MENEIKTESPIIDATAFRFTAVESDDDNPQVRLCFYAAKEDMQREDRANHRVGAIEFPNFEMLSNFFALNGHLVKRLSQTDKFKRS